MDNNLPIDFERTLVETVIKLAEKQDLNYAQFAKKAYGDNDSAIRKWRKQRREEKPQASFLTRHKAAATFSSLVPLQIKHRILSRL